MQINSNEIEYIVGDSVILNAMSEVPSLRMFSNEAVGFLSALSKELMNDKNTREYVDVVSYAYWIRKSSLENARNVHGDYKHRLGRGIAFHIAPSNIPVNFAVSMTSSILAGNCTVIRVSNKEFKQVDLICDAINRLLDSSYSFMRKYLCILRYSHSQNITQQLSSICDLRIIWGGNQTIKEIRKAELPPRAVEMTFADRYSIAVIDSDYYMECDAKKISKDFYTDTYYSDQNACSSTRLVVWTGKSVPEARDRFWNTMHILVERDYNIKPIQSVEKYLSVCMLGASGYNVHLVSSDNYIVRAEVEELSPKLMDYRSSGGLFFEYIAENLAEIVPVLTKSCQTVSVLGINKQEIKELVFNYGVRGVDRVVTMGQTMGIEFFWDGYKMIDNMTRIVYAEDNE